MRSKHKTLKKWISGLVVVCLAGFLGACQEISVGQLKIMEAHGENETQTADKEKDVAQQEPDQEEKAKPEDAVFSYLQGTKSYEKEKEWGNLHCYLDGISQEIMNTSDQMWTGNVMIDLILNQKSAEAREKGIKMNILIVKSKNLNKVFV